VSTGRCCWSTAQLSGLVPTLPEPEVLTTPAPTRTKARVTGVDVARGPALLGMMAEHVFDDFDDSGPTATRIIASATKPGLRASGEPRRPPVDLLRHERRRCT
jgi:hypothetical protein